MATNAFGLILEWDRLADDTWIAISEIQDVSGPNTSRETIEVTSHGSPDGWKEFIGGLKDAGELMFTMLFDPTNQAQLDLFASYGDDACENGKFRLTMPACDPTVDPVWLAAGFLTAYGPPSNPVNGAQTVDVTIKLTGPATLTVTP